MNGTAVEALVAPQRAAVGELLTNDLTRLTGTDLAELVAAVETERRRLVAVDHRHIAELTERGVAHDYGTSSPSALLGRLLRLSPVEARSRVARAAELGPRRDVTGQALSPVLPVAAAAVHDGVIGPAHASVISRCLLRIPVAISVEAVPVAERFLVDAARHEDPKALARTAEVLLLRLDPDGRAPREGEAERRRGFDLHVRADGTSTARGELTAEVTAVWQTIFDSLAAPAPGDDPDTRSAGQRRHDALADAGLRLLRSATLPASGGVPVTVLVRTTLDDLRSAADPEDCAASPVCRARANRSR